MRGKATTEGLGKEKGGPWGVWKEQNQRISYTCMKMRMSDVTLYNKKNTIKRSANKKWSLTIHVVSVLGCKLGKEKCINVSEPRHHFHDRDD